MPCFVYFIQAEDGGPVKVGIALDPQRRLAQLQTAHPYRLVVRRRIEERNADVARDTEARLHSLFDAYRLTGEWFAPCQALAAIGDAVAGDTPPEPVPYPTDSGCAYSDRWERWKRKAAASAAWAEWQAEADAATAEHERLLATDPAYRLRCDELELLWDGAPITARPNGYLADEDRRRIENRRRARRLGLI